MKFAIEIMHGATAGLRSRSPGREHRGGRRCGAAPRVRLAAKVLPPGRRGRGGDAGLRRQHARVNFRQVL